jgi:plasmid stabilization system protein ParE
MMPPTMSNTTSAPLPPAAAHERRRPWKRPCRRATRTRNGCEQRLYLVIYTEDENAISILRVLHGAQQWRPERD